MRSGIGRKLVQIHFKLMGTKRYDVSKQITSRKIRFAPWILNASIVSISYGLQLYQQLSHRPQIIIIREWHFENDPFFVNLTLVKKSKIEFTNTEIGFSKHLDPIPRLDSCSLLFSLHPLAICPPET